MSLAGRILSLFADDLDQHSLLPLPVEFAVEDLFPRSEIQLAVRDCHDDFASHDLTLDVRVRVILTSVVVAILVNWFMRYKPLEKIIGVLQETPLIIIDVHTRTYVHRIDEAEPFSDAALLQSAHYLRRNVDVRAPRLGLKRKFFSVRFHEASILRRHSQIAKDKRIDVCGLLDALRGVAGAMAGFCVDPNESGITARLRMLYRRRVFE